MSDSVVTPGWWRAQADAMPAANIVAGSEPAGVLRLPFWALIAFTLIMILAPQNYFPALKPLHLALLTGALASGTYVFSRFAGTAGRIMHSPALTIAALLFLWALASIPFSLWPGGSFTALFDSFIKALIIFWLLGRVVNTVSRLRTVAWTLVLVSIPLSISAITSFMHVGAVNPNLVDGMARITGYNAGLTANPNDMALMINITLPFAIGLLVSARKFSTRILLVCIAFLDVLAVLATYSRGGFLTLATIVIAYLFCLRGRARMILLITIFGFGLIAIPMIPSGYYSRLSTITDIKADRTDSAQKRWTDMVYAAKLVGKHPVIGAGAGMDYLALHDSRDGTWQHVHNIYLEYAVDLGLPGLLLFGLLYYKVFTSVRAAKRATVNRAGQQVLYHLSESIWVVLIAFGVSAMFHPIAYEFYFYYIAGLAVAAGSIVTAQFVGNGIVKESIKA